MVKGISRQVIVVHSPDKKLFDQAIFILRENASGGVSDESLLKEAKRLMNTHSPQRHLPGVFWVAVGAVAMALVWLLCSLL